MEDVLNAMTKEDWSKFFWNTEVYQVDIKIPRFKTTAENDLIAPIMKLGAPSIFDPEKADFSRMCTNYKELAVSRLLQKAVVDVNEKGTKAVAVTAAVIAPTDSGSNPQHKTAYFYCDTPFVYVIQEQSSGAIFFIGTYRGE